MAIRTRRSIAELYRDVSGYDLVLTSDAPLALALNRRIDHPRLGRLAATPRMVASGEFNPTDRRPLFEAVVSRTDVTWKEAGYLVDAILSAWDETGSIDGILDYAEFDTEPTRVVLDVIGESESSYRDLAAYEIDDDLSVAVIGEEQFTALDRSILPDSYTSIDPFADGAFQLPALHLFDSPTGIVDALVATIEGADPEQVGVVLEESSHYRPLLESALESAEIPFHGGPGFSADLDLRTFLRLLRVSLIDGDLRVDQVSGILSHLDHHPPIEDSEKLLAGVDSPAVDSLLAVLEDLEDVSFREAIRVYEMWAAADLDPLSRMLDAVDEIDEPVTAEGVNEIEFYVDAFDLPIRRDDEGVLLASARSSVYVDRPVVFYLGLSVDWTHSIEDKPWIDAEEMDARYLRAFQLLLQNGQDQHYLVQNSETGHPITPCLYFHDLLDEDIDEFRDLDHVSHAVTFERRPDSDGFDREPVPDAPSPETDSTVSNSTLKRLANVPRDVFFETVVTSPERGYFTKGTLFHDFAEFYVLHPDIVHSHSRDALVEFGLETLAPFTPTVDRPLLRTEIEVGYENVIAFVDAFPPESVVFEAYSKPAWADNRFAEYFDVSVAGSTSTEQWFEDPSLGGRGVVDLVHSDRRLVDYKTSSQQTASAVVQNANIDPTAAEPDFQALLYLAHHRRVVPDEELAFSFVHLTDNLDDVVVGEAAIADIVTDVHYHPVEFSAFVATETAFEQLLEGVSESNPRRKTLERLGYEAYHAFFHEAGFPDIDEKDAILEAPVLEAFHDYAAERVGDYAYVERGVKSSLKQMIGIRNRRFFADDVDAFDSFLQDAVEDLNAYRRSRFPVGDDPNWDRVDHRDLILTGADR